MSSATLANVFTELDLTNPEDLLVAFHITRHWPSWPDMDPVESARQMVVQQRYTPMIFGAPDNDQSATIVARFVEDLGGIEPGTTPDTVRPKAPREWLHVFRESFNRGKIGPVTFGVAFRLLIVRAAGNGAPGHRPDSLAARRVMLNDARRACPSGLMRPLDRQKFEHMPDTLTLWRGGRGDFGQTPIGRSRALHWAPEKDHALTYMRGRGAARTVALLEKYAPSVAPDEITEALAQRCFAANAPAIIKTLGQPYLLRATIPKELALAWIKYDAFKHFSEIFVDFHRLTPDMVEDVTPEEYRWAA